VTAQRALIAVALLLMAFHFVVFVLYALSLFNFPFDYDQGEGFELNDTVLLSQGEWPYRNNEVFPYYASNYPPVYHVILIPFAAAFGPAYWYGRAAGFVAALITAAAIAWAVRRASGHRALGWLSGLAFLASNYVYHIGPLFRQHMTMVMFETLGIVLLAVWSGTEAGNRRRGRLLFLALLCLLLAGYTKQLSLATVVAAFVFLGIRGVRRALIVGIVFAVVVGGIFLLLNTVTDGQWWLNVITANVNQFIPGQFFGLFSQFIGLHGALVVLALALLAYELYFDRLSVYSVWLVAAALNSVLAGKWGAGDSYFVTLIAATCIMAGIVAGRALNNRQVWPPRFAALKPLIGALAAALFIAYGAAVLKMPLTGPVFGPLAEALRLQSNTKFPDFYDSAGWTMGYATIGQFPSAADVAAGERIVSLVRDEPRPILSEEAAFSFAAGKPVVTNPTQLLNLYNNSAFDPTNLVADITAQRFGAVILRAAFYPEPVLEAIRLHYTPSEFIEMNGYEYTVLLPRE
jgi:4-amino-4-deoxy-L-arabinose transferase-like glycosyltransferase